MNYKINLQIVFIFIFSANVGCPLPGRLGGTTIPKELQLRGIVFKVIHVSSQWF